MKFSNWLIIQETTLKSMLSPVPQSPKHHAEGSVWAHSKMVRKQLNDSIQHFQELVKTDPLFSNFDPNLTPEDINLLRIAGWVHDIGKAKATRVDGQPWQNTSVNPDSKITAYGHEDPDSFEPMMQQLGQPWQQMYANASEQDKQDLWFVIKYHMDLRGTGFSKGLLNQAIENGKFKNERKIKLLLIIIMMDQTGRLKIDGMRDSFQSISDRMRTSVSGFKPPRTMQSKMQQSPEEFANSLRQKGMPEEQIQDILKKKYGG